MQFKKILMTRTLGKKPHLLLFWNLMLKHRSGDIILAFYQSLCDTKYLLLRDLSTCQVLHMSLWI